MAWLPLESNPDVMNKFLIKMGISDEWRMVDVFGLDSEALAWVPRPVLAVILLFPCSERFYKHAAEQQKQIEANGQKLSKDLYYLKQMVSNACGTIALLHCIANNTDRLEIKNEMFKKMLEDSKNMTPEERGKLLQKPTTEITSMHAELAQEGQTEANPNDEVNHHFVAFVHKDGDLYELDGRKEFPINHGPTSPDTLLEDAARVCKEFVARDSDDVNFTVMALASSAE